MHPVSKTAHGTARLRRALRFAAVAMLSALPALVGCSTRCPSEDHDTLFQGGTTDSTGTVYESGPVTGPFLYFPGGRTYKLLYKLLDHLPGPPQEIETFVAFNDKGAFSESAGNQTVIRDVTDEFVRVNNDTCADFYLRVVARWSDFSDGGAVSDEGAVSDTGAPSDAGAGD
jgi:hypothetical protein